MSDSVGQVFISYAGEDRPIVTLLAQALSARGLPVAFDRDLRLGEEWQPRLEEMLAAASAVLVVWSQSSKDSAWVVREATLAGNRLVPVVLGPDNIPSPFASIQAIDLSGWEGEPRDPRLDAVAAAVRGLLPWPATMDYTSRTVERIRQDFSGQEVTASRIAQELQRLHPDYGSADVRFSSVPLDPERGRRRRVEDWLAATIGLYDPVAVADSSHQVIDGQLVLAGLAELDPDLRSMLEPAGFLRTLRTGLAVSPPHVDPVEAPRTPTRPLLHGARGGRDVRAVQFALRANELDPGEADGIYGPVTAEAVRRFQRASGLSDDGVVGPSTWDSLAKSPGGRALDGERLEGTLHGATSGHDVLEVQAALLDWGYDPGPIDGVYGPLTAAAVTSFQSAMGVTQDEIGVVGPETWATLYPSVGGRHQPNPTVARDYWTTDDSLGYYPYAQAIADFIQHPDTKPPLTIGIKGAWGSGKTSVMRMVQAILDPPLDRDESVWRFQRLTLTKAGLLALTSSAADGDGGAAVTPADISAPSVKTVLDRAGVAPSGEPDLESPIAATDMAGRVIRPTVWFNPWMYQTGEQLWAGLVHQIITQITGRLPWYQRERFWLELNLRRVNRDALRRKVFEVLLRKLVLPLALFLLGIVAFVVLRALDANVWAVVLGALPSTVGVIEGLRRGTRMMRQNAASVVPWMVDGPIGLPRRGDVVNEVGTWTSTITDPRYNERAGFLYFLQADVQHVLNLVATPEKPMVVFIDDLDRCSPGVVAQTIEAVNLFLAGEFPNCIFIMAIEPVVVAAHIETAYKDLVDKLEQLAPTAGWSQLGWRFLEKIVQLPLALPPPTPGVARDFVASLFAKVDRTDGGDGSPDDKVWVAVNDQLQRLEVQTPQPTLASIQREKADVEQRLLRGENLDPTTARLVANEVAVRRFSRSFSDEDDDVKKVIIEEALRLPNRNPREIKRLVNLFRFYALIINQKRILVEAESKDEVFAQVARAAALSNRWPHLLGTFGVPVGADSHGAPRVLLEELEDEASGPDSSWLDIITRYSMLGRSGTGAELEGLREFLREGTRIGNIARELL